MTWTGPERRTRLTISGPWGLLEIVIVLQIGLDHYVEAAVVSGLLLFNATLGFIQEGRANAALTALRKESGEKSVIGVNKFVEREEHVDIEMHPYDPTTANRQIARTQRVRRERDNRMVQALLEKLVHVAKNDTQNIMPVTIELVREGATMGDIVEQLKTVWGTYRETPVF